MLGFGFCHRKPQKIYKTDKQLLAHEEEYPIKPLTPSFKYALPLLWSLFLLYVFSSCCIFNSPLTRDFTVPLHLLYWGQIFMQAI